MSTQNESLENILQFVKEAILINNKTVYDIDHFLISNDLNELKIKFSDIPSINVNFQENKDVIFKLSYISDASKKELPLIPDKLKEYIDYKNGKITSLSSDIGYRIMQVGLYADYEEFKKEYEKIVNYNSLIDEYNELYLKYYYTYKDIYEKEVQEEVVFGKYLLVYKTPSGKYLKRYIIEKTLNIEISERDRAILFKINKNKFIGLASDYLNADWIKIFDKLALLNYVNEVNDKGTLEEDTEDEIIKKFLRYLSLQILNYGVNLTEGCFKSLGNDQFYIFPNKGIFVRKTSKSAVIKNINSILSTLDDSTPQASFLKAFNTDFSNEKDIEKLLKADTNDNEETLFPLPSNDEQYKIVERTKSSNFVLVQGAPGTGKSHTIANLISNFISQGKRVLVTSEKSKALEVLYDKIPEKIRPLCIPYLGEGSLDKKLELSIDTINKNQKTNEELNALKNEISKLDAKLKTCKKEKEELTTYIVNLMSKDTKSYEDNVKDYIEFGGNDYSLVNIAKRLKENEKFCLNDYNFNENFEVEEAIKVINKFSNYDQKLLSEALKIEEEIPLIDVITKDDLKYKLSIIKELREDKFLLNFDENEIKNFDYSNIDLIKIKEINHDLQGLFALFGQKWLDDNCTYNVFKAQIDKLISVIEKNKDLVFDSEFFLFSNDVVAPNYEINLDILYLQEIIKIIVLKGKLSFFDKLKFSKQTEMLSHIKINGNELNISLYDKETLTNILKVLKYISFINEIHSISLKILEKDLFEILNIKKNEFGKKYDEFLLVINNVNNYRDLRKTLDEKLSSISSNKDITSTLIKNNEVDSFCLWLEKKSEINQFESDIRSALNDFIDTYKKYNLSDYSKFVMALQEFNLANEEISKNKIYKEICEINKIFETKKVHSNFLSLNLSFIEYFFKCDEEKRNFLINNLKSIVNYNKVKKFFINVNDENDLLPTYFKKLNNKAEEERKITTDLVEKKGWYFQCQNMTYTISSSLNRWLNYKKKYGKGTGKNALNYLKLMDKEMKTSKDAIPVWIMPLNRVFEQFSYDADSLPFDVVIMDESSQTSILDFTGLAIAKKAIIVGDDKQISPTNAFIDIDVLNSLREKYLKGSKWSYLLSNETSVYDFVQMICGNQKIILSEHFRCLPEIIRFSNEVFYNNQINPLRVRSSENTIEKPILTRYVEGATCTRKGSNNLINLNELEETIKILKEIEVDPRYKNKTIGIIIMQSPTYAVKTLYQMINSNFSEKFINDRKLKIGSSYDFQGDEKDVIIINLVVSRFLNTGEKYSFTALTKKENDRAFNVAASRAKEQEIIVHSVKLDELNPSDNRFKLLNYCLNYEKHICQIANKPETEFEKEIYNELINKGYKVSPKFNVGHYQIDLALSSENNAKIAITCDGDGINNDINFNNELKNEFNLERCGWRFIHIRAVDYYLDKEKILNSLINEIEEILNEFKNSFSLISNVSKETFDKVEENESSDSAEFNDSTKEDKKSSNGNKKFNDLLNKIYKLNEEIDHLETKYNLTNQEDNKQNSSEEFIDELENNIAPKKTNNKLNEETDDINLTSNNDNNDFNQLKNNSIIDEEKTNDNLNDTSKNNSYIEIIENPESESDNNDSSFTRLTPTEYKYMVLLSLGYKRSQIAIFYAVAYETVKKALQSVAKKYNESDADNSIEEFTLKHQNDTLFKNIENRAKIHFGNNKKGSFDDASNNKKDANKNANDESILNIIFKGKKNLDNGTSVFNKNKKTITSLSTKNTIKDVQKDSKEKASNLVSVSDANKVDAPKINDHAFKEIIKGIKNKRSITIVYDSKDNIFKVFPISYRKSKSTNAYFIICKSVTTNNFLTLRSDKILDAYF